MNGQKKGRKSLLTYNPSHITWHLCDYERLVELVEISKFSLSAENMLELKMLVDSFSAELDNRIKRIVGSEDSTPAVDALQRLCE